MFQTIIFDVYSIILVFMYVVGKIPPPLRPQESVPMGSTYAPCK